MITEKSKKILIAEDSRDIGNILKAELEVKGCHVLTSKGGEETLSIMNSERPDIIILDVMMRDSEGVQVCRKIRAEKKFKDIPMILLSSDNQGMGDVLKKEFGAAEFISKPFIASEIEKIVTKYLWPEAANEKKISIEESIEKKKKDKKPFVLCSFELHPDASLIFEQKYGQIRYSEVIDRVMQLIEEHAQKQDKGMILEQDAEDKFKLLMEGETEKIKAVIENIKTEVNTALRSFYNRIDLQQGFVIRPDILTGKATKVPLLSINTDISFS